jgi:hypothetical protein
MEGEIAVEPLSVGYFHKSLDELFCPIVAIDIGTCQDAVCILKFLYLFGHFSMEELAQADPIMAFYHLLKGWGHRPNSCQVDQSYLSSVD